MLRRLEFSYPFRVGVDIINLKRLEGLLQRGRLERFVQKVLHPTELQDLTSKIPRWATVTSTDKSTISEITNFVGGRWAAKEAARKAIGARLARNRDVRVNILKSGAVEIIYHRKLETGEVVEQSAPLSISHDADLAMALVIAVPLESALEA